MNCPTDRCVFYLYSLNTAIAFSCLGLSLFLYGSILGGFSLSVMIVKYIRVLIVAGYLLVYFVTY